MLMLGKPFSQDRRNRNEDFLLFRHALYQVPNVSHPPLTSQYRFYQPLSTAMMLSVTNIGGRHGESIDSRVYHQMACGRLPLSSAPLSIPTEHLQHCVFGGAARKAPNWLAAGRVFQRTMACANPQQTPKRWGTATATYQRALNPPRASV
jgi:hypothetical protein